jgi:hypothetical protein
MNMKTCKIYKICKICKIEFEYNPKRRYISCVNCINKKEKEKRLKQNPYRSKNKELSKEGKKLCKYCDIIKDFSSFRNNRLKCLDCERQNGRDYRKSYIGKEKSITWSNNNNERHKYLKATWYQNNKEHVSKRIKERYDAKPELKFIRNYRRRLRNAIKKEYKSSKYIDCSWKILQKYLIYYIEEFPDFTLNNYGSYWHIDHVIPISRINLENISNYWVLKWFNLAPLSKIDNLTKNNKIWVSQLKHHKTILQKFILQENIINNDINNLFKYMAKHLDAGTS